MPNPVAWIKRIRERRHSTQAERDWLEELAEPAAPMRGWPERDRLEQQVEMLRRRAHIWHRLVRDYPGSHPRATATEEEPMPNNLIFDNLEPPIDNLEPPRGEDRAPTAWDYPATATGMRVQIAPDTPEMDFPWPERYCAIIDGYVKDDREIVVHVPHGTTAEPIIDERIHIWIFAAPVGSRGLISCSSPTAPPSMFGFDVRMQDAVYPQERVGEAIACDEGAPVAEAVGNNLFIYHDIVHYNDPSSHEILKRILREFNESIIPGGIPEGASREERRLHKFRAALASHWKQNERGKQRQSEQLREESRNLRQQALQAARRAEQLEAEILGLRQTSSDFDEKADRELENVLSIPEVEDVTVQRTRLSVFTTELEFWCEMSERYRQLGQIEIMIDLERGSIRFDNHTRMVIDRPHPHCNYDGEPCWGEAGDTVFELLSRGEIADLVMFLIRFLQSTNAHDSWGENSPEWPEA